MTESKKDNLTPNLGGLDFLSKEIKMAKPKDADSSSSNSKSSSSGGSSASSSSSSSQDTREYGFTSSSERGDSRSSGSSDRGDRSDRGESGGSRGDRSEGRESRGGRYQSHPRRSQSSRGGSHGGSGYGSGRGGRHGGGSQGGVNGNVARPQDLDLEGLNVKGDVEFGEPMEPLPNFDPTKVISMKELNTKPLEELLEIGVKYNVVHTNRMLKQDIIYSILKQASATETVLVEGVVEVMQDGFGFLRSVENNYVPSATDVYIPQNQVKKHGVRTGDVVTGYAREPKRGERYFSISKMLTINDEDINNITHKINFDNLVPLYPNKKLNLDINIGAKVDIATRVIDLVSPIGKGQRALIVAPPRTGKTILLQNIAHAINTNHPEVKLIVLLVDERPEEVTDMTRSVKGEVVSSTFDEPADRHVALAEIVIAKAKRMVEDNKDVVILLDSITRLARAYNTVVPSSGKVLTGGVDSNALQKPKRFFGAARNTGNGGSLTIIATALVDTGSKMDEVIFEEFKGTGNCEIVLDRKLAEKRLFPAIDVLKSGTRKEEEMIDAETLQKMWLLRRLTTKMNDQVSSSSDALEFLLREIKKTKDNTEFFLRMNRS